MDIILPIFVTALFIVGLGFLIMTLTVGWPAVKKEQRAYENMIIAPSDSTVSQYIDAFTACHNNFFAKTPMNSGLTLNRLRQAQGYSEVVKNPEVSAEIKERLKTILSAKGVPVEI